MTRLRVSAEALDVPLEVIQELDSAARAMDVRMVVVGALARGIIVREATQQPPSRVTRDVDVAIAVLDPSHLQALIDRLTARGSVQKGEHRVQVHGVDVDIVPFGDIAVDNHVDFENTTLDVSGLAEAADNAVEVELLEDVVVEVAPLQAQLILKLLAWRDRQERTDKDATDWIELITVACEGRYGDDLYDSTAGRNSEDPLTLEGYLPDLAGARRMGLLACQMAMPDTRSAVTELLEDASAMADFRRRGRDRLGEDSRLSAFIRGWEQGKAAER